MHNLSCYGEKLQHLCTRLWHATQLYFISYGKKLQHLCTHSWHTTQLFISCVEKLQRLRTNSWHVTKLFLSSCYSNILFTAHPFLMHVFYFLSLSFLGFGILKCLPPRTSSSVHPRNIDLFFTSVSAATVSSMSTLEMELFSNSQLIVLTVLMFVGGEIFTSMVRLVLKRSEFITWKTSDGKVGPVESNHGSSLDQVELGIVSYSLPETVGSTRPFVKYESIKFLGFVVLGYIIVMHILGTFSVLIYFALVESAGNVLKEKGLKTSTFAIFTTVSSFANCGFVPTNENMMVFSENTGLLLILIPQLLFGNVLFPSCLRFTVWVLGKKIKKSEAEYLLKNTSEAGYLHFLPRLHGVLIVATAMGFVLIGCVLFWSMEWESVGLSGLNSYQKVVAVVFESLNARHAGETILDLSTVAPAVLVFLVAMMYLPPYTSYLPIISKSDEQSLAESQLGRNNKENRRKTVAENFLLSQLSYLVVFVIIICITERKSLKEDPINFSVLNIIFEVISAYGNVGFTTGYSCDRRTRPDPKCVNKWIGFAGKWSDEGKIVLIIVMFFGRLKEFNMNIGGRAWKLL